MLTISDIEKADEIDLLHQCYVIATRNSTELVGNLKNCVTRLKEGIPGSSADNSVFQDNWNALEAQKKHQTNWLSFWEELLATSFDSHTKCFADIHAFLKSKGKRIVLLIDGLEEIPNGNRPRPRARRWTGKA